MERRRGAFMYGSCPFEFRFRFRSLLCWKTAVQSRSSPYTLYTRMVGDEKTSKENANFSQNKTLWATKRSGLGVYLDTTRSATLSNREHVLNWSERPIGLLRTALILSMPHYTRVHSRKNLRFPLPVPSWASLQGTRFAEVDGWSGLNGTRDF